MSLSTLPAPTEGSWSTSPTRIRSRQQGDGLEQVVHEGRIDHGGLVDDEGIGVKGVVSSLLNLPSFGLNSRRRWMVLA